jgi:hypothetical protein
MIAYYENGTMSLVLDCIKILHGAATSLIFFAHSKESYLLWGNLFCTYLTKVFGEAVGQSVKFKLGLINTVSKRKTGSAAAPGDGGADPNGNGTGHVSRNGSNAQLDPQTNNGPAYYTEFFDSTYETEFEDICNDQTLEDRLARESNMFANPMGRDSEMGTGSASGIGRRLSSSIFGSGFPAPVKTNIELMRAGGGTSIRPTMSRIHRTISEDRQSQQLPPPQLSPQQEQAADVSAGDNGDVVINSLHATQAPAESPAANNINVGEIQHVVMTTEATTPAPLPAGSVYVPTKRKSNLSAPPLSAAPALETITEDDSS